MGVFIAWTETFKSLNASSDDRGGKKWMKVFLSFMLYESILIFETNYNSTQAANYTFLSATSFECSDLETSTI